MRIKQTTLGALLNQINGLAGASALAAASICSARQTFVQAGLGEDTVYLYTYEAAAPAMVVFLKGEGDTVLATGSFMLNEEFIHTVGPVWQGGGRGKEQVLCSCYQTSLALAKAHGCRSTAFPLISAGAYGYPKAEALRAAVESIEAFLQADEMKVALVLYQAVDYALAKAQYPMYTA